MLFFKERQCRRTSTLDVVSKERKKGLNTTSNTNGGLVFGQTTSQHEQTAHGPLLPTVSLMARLGHRCANCANCAPVSARYEMLRGWLPLILARPPILALDEAHNRDLTLATSRSTAHYDLASSTLTPSQHSISIRCDERSEAPPSTREKMSLDWRIYCRYVDMESKERSLPRN